VRSAAGQRGRELRKVGAPSQCGGHPHWKTVVILHANQYLSVLFGVILGSQKILSPQYFNGGSSQGWIKYAAC